MEGARPVWVVSGTDLKILAEKIARDPNLRDLFRADVRSAVLAAGIAVPEGVTVRLPDSFYSAMGLSGPSCCS